MQDYNISIKKDILEKIKQFEPINLNGNKNNKKRERYCFFKKINDYEGNINTVIHNAIREMIFMKFLQNRGYLRGHKNTII